MKAKYKQGQKVIYKRANGIKGFGEIIYLTTGCVLIRRMTTDWERYLYCTDINQREEMVDKKHIIEVKNA